VVLAFSFVTAVAAVCALCVLGLVLAVVAPSRKIRQEARLDPDVEARLLLGHDPDEIDRDLQAETAGGAADAPAPVADLHPGE
jgi:hypothetical protein